MDGLMIFLAAPLIVLLFIALIWLNISAPASIRFAMYTIREEGFNAQNLFTFAFVVWLWAVLLCIDFNLINTILDYFGVNIEKII